MNTRPLATVGDDSPMASPALYRQRSLPSARPTAINSPVAVPAYTTSSTIAGDESNASPPSHAHASFGAGAIVVDEMPVSAYDPRNCGQESGGAANRFLSRRS